MKFTLAKLIENNAISKLNSAAKILKIKTQNLENKLLRIAQSEGNRILDYIDYMSTDPELDCKPIEYIENSLNRYLNFELLKIYNKGIFSLSEKSECHLMWSHYAKNHTGFCIGYSVDLEKISNLHQVKYNSSPIVKASDIYDMTKENKAAMIRVDEAVLLRKASAWSYEQEYRLIGEVGLQDSPFDIAEIIFGLRTPPEVIHSIARSLNGRDPAPDFYIMQQRPKSFEIFKASIDVEYYSQECDLPRRALSILEEFEDMEHIKIASTD